MENLKIQFCKQYLKLNNTLKAIRRKFFKKYSNCAIDQLKFQKFYHSCKIAEKIFEFSYIKISLIPHSAFLLSFNLESVSTQIDREIFLVTLY